MKIKAIVTGASGMVGEGVLHECCQRNEVEEILVVGRRTCGYNHPKVKEIIQANLYDLSSIENNFCYIREETHPGRNSNFIF